MKLSRLSTIVLVAGVIIAAAGLSWWFLFYGEAVKQFETGGYGDVVKCLYSYESSCQIVNRSVALLGGTSPYNPAVFLAGLGVGLVGIILKLLPRVRST